MNHVFVDFENIATLDASVIGDKSVSFYLLVGANQKKLDIEIVEKLIHHSDSVQLIRRTGSGKNALDFTLAYYVGRAAVTDPTGYFNIISQDKGYQPLIDHLESRKIKAHLYADFKNLSFASQPKVVKAVPVASLKEKPIPAPQKAATKKATPPSPKSSLERALDLLRKNPKARPKGETKLRSYLKASLGKITEAELGILVEHLKSKEYLEMDEKGLVTYNLPSVRQIERDDGLSSLAAQSDLGQLGLPLGPGDVLW